jgi:thioredoxin reductase (NADPH)
MVGRDCVIVGGGDAAFQEAAILARVARSVTLIVRGDTPRARADLVAQALRHDRLRILFNRRVTGIVGDDWVTGVTLDSEPGMMACQGLFAFIGGVPQTAFLPAAIPRDERGGIVCDARGASTVPGLWAIGAVRSGFAGGLRDAGDDAGRAIAALPA